MHLFLRRPGARELADTERLRGFGKHPGDDPAKFLHFLSDTESLGDFVRCDVGYPGPAIRTNQDGVFGEKIVRDIFARKIVHYFSRDLHRLERRPFIQGNSRLAQPLHRTAGKIFAGVEIDAVALAGLIDGKNIGMPDIGLDACIGHESLNLQGILRELSIKHIKANLPAHACLQGPIN